jgi:hypothetical protein
MELKDVGEGRERDRVSRLLHVQSVVHHVQVDGKIRRLKIFNSSFNFLSPPPKPAEWSIAPLKGETIQIFICFFSNF